MRRQRGRLRRRLRQLRDGELRLAVGGPVLQLDHLRALHRVEELVGLDRREQRQRAERGDRLVAVRRVQELLLLLAEPRVLQRVERVLGRVHEQAVRVGHHAAEPLGPEGPSDPFVDRRGGGQLQAHRLGRRHHPRVELVVARLPKEDVEQLGLQLEVQRVDQVLRADAAHLDQHRALLAPRRLHPAERLLALGLGDHALAHHHLAQALGEQVALDRNRLALAQVEDLLHLVAPQEQRAGQALSVQLGQDLGEGLVAEVPADRREHHRALLRLHLDVGDFFLGRLIRQLLAFGFLLVGVGRRRGRLLRALRKPVAQRVLQRVHQLLQVDRLFEERERAVLAARFLGEHRAGVDAGDHDDRHVPALGRRVHFLGDVVPAQRGQVQVEQHGVERALLEGPHRPLAVALHRDGEALPGQGLGQEPLHRAVVIDDENVDGGMRAQFVSEVGCLVSRAYTRHTRAV